MLVKQGIDIPFSEGLDTKTDPKRVQMGKFLQLVNSVFDKGGLLQKRNGYGSFTSLPDTTYSYLTTFNDNLTAIGPHIAAYNNGGQSWVSRGSITPLSLSTLPVIRNNLNQTAVDVAVASNGVACAVYLETDGTTTTNKYVIFDSVTGQNIKAPAIIPVASGTVTGGMRVFVLGMNFVMVFTNVITAVSHLQYVSVNTTNPTIVSANTDIASSYISATTLSWDGFVSANRLYIAYNTTTGGQAVKVTYMTNSFTVATPVTFAGSIATMMTVTADETNPATPIIYVSFYDAAGSTGYTLAVDQNLNTEMAPQQIIATGTMLNIASAAQNGSVYVFWEVSNAYAWTSAFPANNIQSRSVTAATTAVSSLAKIVRGVGLASKAFIMDGKIYFLTSYQTPYQPTYFLIDYLSRETAPIIVAKLAYENGGGLLTKGLPSVTVFGNIAAIGYLLKDLIQAANKNTNVPTGSQVNGIYSQTGVNIAGFTFGTEHIDTAEIGKDLNFSGGFLGMYDGYLPVEQGFFLYPDTDQASPANSASWSATGGLMASHPQGGTTPDPNPGAYFYQFTYEWTDNQGNAFRSAPSIPVAVTTTGVANTGSVTINVPMLRLTMKTSNPVKIVIYRWSLGQQNYYQVTSITSPQLNDPSADTLLYIDRSTDAAILGNNLLYTTGGVVENIAPPATDVVTIFDTRLWLINAEDQNQLWFSKPVIEGTPVEMSDLFTVYVPPTTGTGQSTGPNRTLAPMDDKLIIGKDNAFVYINGTGPDITGANNQYSEPVFITSTVGCTNQRSIVLMPRGLMFQSNKGIWLLDRSLQTSYIGAPVQDLTLGATVLSAVNVPETNQVRFTLDSGVTLMYDYYYDQWGGFEGVPCVSSCIYQGLHTFINDLGAAYQETPGSYLDGSSPVLMRFKTGPLRLEKLQGYQRAYFFYLLGDFISPHKLQVLINYDYEKSPSQSVLITPDNYSTPFGSGASQSPFGQGDPFGGGSDLELWRVFLEKQRCMAFGITVQEIFDPTYGTTAGAGLTLSGLNVVCAFKKAFRPQPAAQSIG